ncbi:hypothetical protein PR048_009450 [Dryococelus australis]|uniref:DDE Tnp4 domain-containing protein n=1 Tax=Dryococelus australis TaxID=614101 RepID=A0ABQ9I110_9NEOP|nr:hypothetical protein PR048_009450 [Dryococelus australis]
MEERCQVIQKKMNFAHCLRAIDGKHVTIVPPVYSRSKYYNYKTVVFLTIHFSTNLSTIASQSFQANIIRYSTTSLPYVFVGE